MSTLKRLFVHFLIVMIILSLISCSTNSSKSNNARKWKETDKIYIGVSIPKNDLGKTSRYLEGIELAKDEFNKTGLNGKKIVIKPYNDGGTVTGGIGIANNKFCADQSISAVIGHLGSTISIPCAEIYNKQKIVMIAPNASSTSLLKDDYRYVFQNTVDDSYMAKIMSEYAFKNKYKNIAIFYSSDGYGKSLANTFENKCLEKGIEIVDRISGIGSFEQFKQTADKLRAVNCDAIFIADSMKTTAKKYLESIYKSDINLPILGADGLDYDDDIKEIKEKYKNKSVKLVFGTYYNPNLNDEKIISFKQKFSKQLEKHVHNVKNFEPDTKAVQAYEAFTLLCKAIKKANSANPEKIKQVLHEKNNKWDELTSNVSFSENGKISNKKVFIKKFENGVFKFD
jgi:branched-chain amino acid transport system substrate-binding protein